MGILLKPYLRGKKNNDEVSMRKTARPSQVLDKFHKGFVWGCLGLTAYGFWVGGWRFYNYMTVVRPQRLADKQQLIKEDEEELRS